MNKIKKIFKALFRLIKQPQLLNLLIDSEIEMKKYVQKKYRNNDGLEVIRFTDIVEKEIEVKPFASLNGGCLVTDLALLKAVAKKNKVKDYFEIGTWRGESVANVADVVENCVTLNLSDDELYKLGSNKSYVDLHGFFSKNKKNIKHIYGNSLTKDLTEHYGKYDMVFIDGDHHYGSVLKDTQTAFRLLKDENSVIVWHDYATAPESVRWSVFAAILDGSSADQRKNIFHVSNTMCAIYGKNLNYKTSKLLKYEKPSYCFKIDITASEC